MPNNPELPKRQGYTGLPDLDHDEQLLRRQTVMLEHVYSLISALNRGTDRNTAKGIVFADSSINIWNGSVGDVVDTIKSFNPGKEIAGLREAISIARFYVEHDVTLPEKVVFLSSEESKEEKLFRETKKVLYFYTSGWFDKKQTILQFPRTYKRTPLSEQKKLITPDIFIAHCIPENSNKAELEVDISGVENILIGGGIYPSWSTGVLKANLTAENTVGILSGSNIGRKYDNITIKAEGDIYQEVDTQNHALTLTCDNYHFQGGSISLTEEAGKQPHTRILVTCQGEFIEEGGDALLPNQVIINDKHLPQRQAATATSIFVGHHGIDASTLPEGLAPEQTSSRRKDVIPLDEHREAFEKRYKDNISPSPLTIEHEGVKTRVQSYLFPAYGEEDAKRLAEFLRDCVGTEWDYTVHYLEHRVIITVKKEI